MLPKRMLTSIGPRQKGNFCSRITARNRICFDRVRTALCVSSVPFDGLRFLNLSMWSQVTFVFLAVSFSHRQLLVFIHK